jgi:hypothetical protein
MGSWDEPRTAGKKSSCSLGALGDGLRTRRKKQYLGLAKQSDSTDCGHGQVANNCGQSTARWAPISSGERPILLGVYIRQKDHVPRGYYIANRFAVQRPAKFREVIAKQNITETEICLKFRHSHNIAKRSTMIRGLTTTIS